MDSHRIKLSEIIEESKIFWWKSHDPTLKIFRCSYITNLMILFVIIFSVFDFFSTMVLLSVFISLFISYVLTTLSVTLLDFYIQKKFVTNAQDLHEIFIVKKNKLREWSTGMMRVKVCILSVLPIWGIFLVMIAITT
jgi:hypothetical protein